MFSTTSNSMNSTITRISTVFTLLALLVAVFAYLQGEQQPLQDSNMAQALNVFRQPLRQWSTQPMTGFHRDGYCRTGAADFGNHAVAGVVTEEFLNFSAEQGNDLRVAGLTGGCKWCLCTSRWLEALQGFRDGRLSKEGIPKVDLDATEESALRKVDLDTFKQYALKSEQASSSSQS